MATLLLIISKRGILNFELFQVDQGIVGTLVLIPTIMILNVILNVTKEGLIKASLNDSDWQQCYH